MYKLYCDGIDLSNMNGYTTDLNHNLVQIKTVKVQKTTYPGDLDNKGSFNRKNWGKLVVTP
jgi:hypothetical protein